MTSPPNSQLREVPLAACRLDAGDITLEATADGKTPIKLRARTGDAVQNWWWGKLVHDMAGFEKPAGSTPLDYCHNDGDVVGYSDTYTTSNDGLDLAGFLTSIAPNDRADEIAKKKRLGVPYQASVFFDPRSIEELMAGAQAEVNGQTVEGPASIIRKWSIRGSAICPYGNDAGTNVELSAVKLSVPRTFTSPPGATMTTTIPTPAQPENAAQLTSTAATPAAASPAPGAAPTDPRVGFLAELKRFNDEFGPQGSIWLSEGKSFEEAAKLHIKAQADKLAAKDVEIASLNTKLASAPRGEMAALSFSSGDKPPPGGTATGANDKLSHLGAIGRFAQSIKMPGSK